MSFARMNNFLFTEEGTRAISCPAGNAQLQLYQSRQGNAGQRTLPQSLSGIKLAVLNFKKLSAYLDSLD